MRSGVLMGLVVAAGVLCVYLPQPCEAQTEGVMILVLQKLSGLWNNKTFEFLGHTCYMRRRPKVSKWKLYHEGKMWCPGWAPFSGKARRKSRSGAAEGATRDFVRQALAKGLVTEDQVKIWLKN